jgi:hypothetical protein
MKNIPKAEDESGNFMMTWRELLNMIKHQVKKSEQP